MPLPDDMPVELCIQAPAICDFDELIGDHPALLQQVMKSLPIHPYGKTTEKRAKFLALREWIMLSSAFDLPCYFCKQETGDGPGDLWMCVVNHWIGEAQLPDGLFPQDNPGPQNPIPYPVQEDPVMRHHINVWLLQIEMAFQTWWRGSPEGCLAVQIPNGNSALRDVSEQVLTLPADLRARAVATNSWPEGGATTVSGRIFLHRPSPELVARRRAEQEAQQLDRQTRSPLNGGNERRL
jgi:hypothetical protein